MKSKSFAPNVRFKCGAWRYRVPYWVSDELKKQLFDGKNEITLSKNQSEALLIYAKFVNELSKRENQPIDQDLPLITIGDLINKYLAEEVPLKGRTTRINNIYSLERIKKYLLR